MYIGPIYWVKNPNKFIGPINYWNLLYNILYWVFRNYCILYIVIGFSKTLISNAHEEPQNGSTSFWIWLRNWKWSRKLFGSFWLIKQIKWTIFMSFNFFFKRCKLFTTDWHASAIGNRLYCSLSEQSTFIWAIEF